MDLCKYYILPEDFKTVEPVSTSLFKSRSGEAQINKDIQE